MSLMDDKINSLSSDELDLLNSDPQMLSEFKSKYSAPPTATQNIMGGVGEALKSSLLPKQDFNAPLQGDASKPLENMPEMLNPISGLTRGYATYKAGVGDVTEKMKDAGDIGPFGKFAIETAADPATWLGMSEKMLPKEITDQIPNLLEKAANIPAKATELEGFRQPIPTQQEIEKAVGSVKETVAQVWKEHGDLLNKAKSASGIPATEDEVAESVRKYGNPSNLNVNEPLDLPERFKTKAPAMEEAPTRSLKKGDTVTATHPDQPPITLKYNSPGMLVGSNDPAFDLAQEVQAPGKTWKHPVDSTLSKSTLEGYGYKVPDSVVQEGFEVDKAGMPMPYKIGAHDSPEQLMTEINRFKANQAYISNADKVKAAHYLQDQITQQGVFARDTAKGVVNGTLKSQYGDLSEIMQASSPSLQAAKSKMADLYDIMDNINKKVSGEPGEAEAYLRRLFTSKSPAVKDDLRALAKIEQLSGKPVLQTLFKKFAGEAYGQMLGESVHTVFQAPYAALTSPRGVISPLMKYGPTALKGAKLGAIGAAEKGLQQPFNTPDMQSLRDRLKNHVE